MGNGKGDLAIPLSELEDYGRKLRSIKERLNHTKKMFESYQDDIGSGTVYDALDDFESHWHDGREDITKQIDSLAGMSDTVVREFKKLDGDLAKKAKDAVRPEAGQQQQGGAGRQKPE